MDEDYVFDRGEAGVCEVCKKEVIVAWNSKIKKFLCRIHYRDVENGVYEKKS